MKKAFLFFVFLIMVLISGCLDIADTVGEVNQTISQTKEDLEFFSWMKDSMQLIKDDYSNVSESLSSRDAENLSKAAIKLRHDSENANSIRNTYSLSPSAGNISDKYGTFLNNSYELGITLEENAPHLELLNMSFAMEEVDKGVMMWDQIYSLLLSRND